MATLRMWEFVQRCQAAQKAVDQVLAEQIVAAGDQVVRGQFIHLGCGGVLTHLQGIAHPVCKRCGREVF